MSLWLTGRGLTAVAEVAGVVLRLVVDSHVVSDVGGRQQLPTDVTGHLLLMTDQVSAQPVPGGEGRGAGLKRTGPQLHHTAQVCYYGNCFYSFLFLEG